MKRKLEEARKLIWENLKDLQIIYLATIDGDKPRVRPVTVMRKGDEIFTVSMSKSSKIEQIKKNNRVEFAFSLPDIGFNSVRVECTAEIIEDKKVRAKIFDSPEHELIKLNPIEFTIYIPKVFENVKIPAFEKH